MILTPVLLLPLLGGTACAVPQDPAPERAPYVAHLDGLTESSSETLRSALAAVPGVARVELDVESDRATLHAKDDAFVARVHVENVLDAHRLELADFHEPQWTKVMVYVVTAAGGG